MIKAIEIIIKNGIYSNNYLISFTNKNLYLNNKKYEVTETFLNNLKNTILYWKNEYGSSKEIDIEEFTVIVYSDEGEDKYHGKGIYPNNYNYFKELLGDYNG